MSDSSRRGQDALRDRVRLVMDFARRDISSRYAGSYLGVAWAFAVPLLSSAVYILVFGMLMRGALLGERYQSFDFTTFYFLGFAPWLLFAEVVGRAPSILRENRNLVRNVQFEHQLLPFVIFTSAALSHAVILLLCVALILFNGYELGSRIYLLPLFFTLLFLFTVGVAYMLAALSAYLPDLGQAVPIFLSLYFFACPILYTPQLVEQAGGWWGKLILVDINPMANIIEGYRMALLGVAAPLGAWRVLAMLLGTLLVFFGGIAVYRYLQKGFADVL
jgi:ABC-type polysaccharide/polyol phosphate export permease